MTSLEIREPQIGGFAHFGLEPPVEGFGLAGLFPAGPAGFHDGAPVPIAVGLELVRSMLRDNGAWCRLEAGEAFAVHVGWDQYLYIGSNLPCETALARTRALGLFPERIDASPYDFAPDDAAYVQRPADADFWAHLHWTVGAYREVFLEEVFAVNASRWHRLTRDNIETVRSQLAPRPARQSGQTCSPTSTRPWPLCPTKASWRSSGRTGTGRSRARSWTRPGSRQ